MTIFPVTGSRNGSVTIGPIVSRTCSSQSIPARSAAHASPVCIRYVSLPIPASHTACTPSETMVS